MKNLLFTLVVLLFTVSCTDQTGITSPDNNTSINENVSLGKRKIKIDPIRVQVYTVSKEINGDLGGCIYLGNAESAYNGQGVYAVINFPAGSFSGTETITMTLNHGDLSGTFSPGMEFNTPVSFSALFTGLDLHNPGSLDFEFVYEAPNGQQTAILNSFLYVNRGRGVIGILNAQIPHFSRYAFLR